MYEELIYVLLMVIYVLKINIFDPNSAPYIVNRYISNVLENCVNSNSQHDKVHDSNWSKIIL